jgi:NADPH:quinone reductase
MRAAWYESQGEARNVLVVGTMEDPVPGPGEVRIAVQRSGINPGEADATIARGAARTKSSGRTDQGRSRS